MDDIMVVWLLVCVVLWWGLVVYVYCGNYSDLCSGIVVLWWCSV
jgi:hypothetical protein